MNANHIHSVCDDHVDKIMTCPLKKHIQQRFQNSRHLGKGRGKSSWWQRWFLWFRWYRRGYCPDFGSWSCCFERKIWCDLSITPDEFTNFDIEVAITHGKLSNQEILVDINHDQVDISDNENDGSVEGESVIKPGIEEVRRAIQTFQNLEKRWWNP